MSTEAPPADWEPPDELDRQAEAEPTITAPRLAAVPNRITLYDTDAEAALLGACLLGATVAHEQLATTTPEMFGDPANALVAAAITALQADGHAIDPVTVADHLRRHAQLDLTGGQGRLLELVATTPATSSAPRYARIVRDLANLRRIQAVGAEITASTTSPGADPTTVATAAQALLDTIHDTTANTSTTTTVGDLASTYLDDLEHRFEHGIAGITTGLDNLDALTGGFRPGTLTVIAGRPGSGKSDLAAAIARRAVDQAPVLYMSLEMSRDELMHRWVAAETGIAATGLAAGKISLKDWERVGPALATLASKPLHVDDFAASSIATMRAAQRRTGAQLIVIDYLQLIDTPAAESRQVAVSAISNGLKRMARQLDLPVIALAQLNRSLEQRADKRPILSDLRESGAIEQDSDLVIGLYRDDYHHPTDSKERGVMEAGVIKNRHGATGVARLAYDPAIKRFAALADKNGER